MSGSDWAGIGSDSGWEQVDEDTLAPFAMPVAHVEGGLNQSLVDTRNDGRGNSDSPADWGDSNDEAHFIQQTPHQHVHLHSGRILVCFCS